ncbi:MAG: FAD:protein FMN transferase [Moraxellaceae bacterium]
MRRLSILLLMNSLLLAGCSLFEKPEPVTLSGLAFFSMGWTVKISALPEGKTATQLQHDLQQRLDAANAVLSTYQNDSELMRFNLAPAGQWVKVSPMLFNAVREAQAVSAATQGRYDISVGPLVNLWGFGPDAVPTIVPTPAAIAAVRQQVGWEKIELDAAQMALRHAPGMRLDLSSMGEGVAVEAMAQYLESLGLHDYMASVAGCTRVRGKKPDGRDWVLAIESPDGSGAVQQVLKLSNRSLSTSGSYRNYHEIEGVRYSHTIDPATGRPITHKGVSVSVVGGDTARVDAWATALNVLGPEEGYALAEARSIPAYFIFHTDKGPQVRYTTAFHAYLPGG